MRYSGLLTRRACIRAYHLVGGCVLTRSSFRAKIPDIVDFAFGLVKLYRYQLHIGHATLRRAHGRFFSRLRISHVGNSRSNDIGFQSAEDGIDKVARIAKSETAEESMGPIRSFRPAGRLLRQSSTCIRWLRMRGCGPESGNLLSPRMRTRMVGVLEFDALPNHVPVECTSTYSIRDGGATTMFHAGYGLSEVKGRKRRGSSTPMGICGMTCTPREGAVCEWLFLLVYAGRRRSSLIGPTHCLFVPDIRRKIRIRNHHVPPQPPAVIFHTANSVRNSGAN